mgnify:CR=1 FL=1
MTTIQKNILATALAGSLAFSGQSFAEIGDYSAVQSLWNITHPQAANNPVDAQLKQDMPFMTFSENPADSSGFDDGFKAKKYQVWQTIDLKGDDDKNGPGSVKCLNGDDYKFLVKRSFSSSNMVVFFEAGGGCWDYDSCSKTAGGQTNSGLLGSMADGLDPDVALRAASQVSLLTTSLRPNYDPKYKDWTKVFLPYCTQDLGLGDKYNTYLEDGGDGVFSASQRGMSVQGAVLTWLKANLEQPKQLIITGQSAGGFASELLYHTYRTALAPEKGYLLNDAGPIMWAPQGENAELYPSQHAHKKVTASWNALTYLEWLENESAGLAQDQRFVATNMGTISNFLSARWPNDRFIQIAARKDNTIAGFTYNLFHDEISSEASLEQRDALRDEMRLMEMDTKRAQLDQLENFGYFAPGYRPLLGGHVLTFPLVEGSATNEDDGNTLFDAIDDVLNGTARVMESWEGDAGLAIDKNGRYSDCINTFFTSGSGMKGGDVYLHTTDSDSSDSPLQSILPCLKNDQKDGLMPWLSQDVLGFTSVNDTAPSQNLVTEQIKGLSNITLEQTIAFAAVNIKDATRIGNEILAAQAAKAKAKADAIAKATDGAIKKAAAAAKAKADAAAAKAKAAVKKVFSRFRRRR